MSFLFLCLSVVARWLVPKFFEVFSSWDLEFLATAQAIGVVLYLLVVSLSFFPWRV